MQAATRFCSVLSGLAWAFLVSSSPAIALFNLKSSTEQATRPPTTATCQNTTSPQFLVLAGGGTPRNTEIALEKNVLYFQRTLTEFGFDPAEADVFFANGNDGSATIRYLDPNGNEQFKVPEIPHLRGTSTPDSLRSWLQDTASPAGDRPLFFYFTGHGSLNPRNDNNNALVLWGPEFFTVQDLAALLDELPSEKPFVTMMAQCYAGSFANLIYEGGNPDRPVALQTRCGFFATIKTRPSVGCTPEVNEADYRDYSSSFFAGLSGRDRIGQSVASADYNNDGEVSYAEAHAFAKVDGQTPDWPVSTVEVWLQEQMTNAEQEQILQQAIAPLQAQARPEQAYVIDSIVEKLGFDSELSYAANLERLQLSQVTDEIQQAFLVRLGMELINISSEQTVRESGDVEAIALLDRLLACESSSWESP